MRKGLYEEVFVHAASYKNICVLRSILLTVVSLFTLMAFGQTVHENTGWLPGLIPTNFRLIGCTL